jgi:hypothetical protein
VGLCCNRFGALGLSIVNHTACAWDGERVYPGAINAVDRIKENGGLLVDPTFVIWQCNGVPAGTGNISPVHQAVMDAVGNLTFEENELPARLASHTAVRVSATLRKYAKDRLPGGRNTKAEVAQRFSPAAMDSFPDMPPSNNISGGILGMTKAALRKSPSADARSVNGKR